MTATTPALAYPYAYTDFTFVCNRIIITCASAAIATTAPADALSHGFDASTADEQLIIRY